MADFEVVYIYGNQKQNLLVSKVYAVEQNNFLIVDGWGNFKWVPMSACTLRWIYELDHYLPY